MKYSIPDVVPTALHGEIVYTAEQIVRNSDESPYDTSLVQSAINNLARKPHWQVV